jgi:hypothetical protein
VGKYWIAVIEKTHGESGEGIMIRCFRDVCEPHEEIEPQYIYNDDRIVYDTTVECDVWRKVDSDTVDFTCRIVYKYIVYRGIIAITVDPFDIIQIADDDELKSLLDIASRRALLVRPM